MLVLKHIATGSGISRVDIARSTGLSKMTVGNIVTELLSSGLAEETTNASNNTSANYGRRPILLTLAQKFSLYLRYADQKKTMPGRSL